MRKKLPQPIIWTITAFAVVVLVLASFAMPAAPAAMAQQDNSQVAQPSIVDPSHTGSMWLNTVKWPNGQIQAGIRVYGPISQGNLKVFAGGGIVLQEWSNVNVADGSFQEFWLDRSANIGANEYILHVLTNGNSNVVSNVGTMTVAGSEGTNQISYLTKVLRPCGGNTTPFADPNTLFKIPALNFELDLGRLAIGQTKEWSLPAEKSFVYGTAPDWVDLVIEGTDPTGVALGRTLWDKVPGSWLECRSAATPTSAASKTPTNVPPTNTPLPTATPTSSPTNLPFPTATNTQLSPTETATNVAPTATNTPLPTATDTPLPTPTVTHTVIVAPSATPTTVPVSSVVLLPLIAYQPYVAPSPCERMYVQVEAKFSGLQIYPLGLGPHFPSPNAGTVRIDEEYFFSTLGFASTMTRYTQDAYVNGDKNVPAAYYNMIGTDGAWLNDLHLVGFHSSNVDDMVGQAKHPVNGLNITQIAFIRGLESFTGIDKLGNTCGIVFEQIYDPNETVAAAASFALSGTMTISSTLIITQ